MEAGSKGFSRQLCASRAPFVTGVGPEQLNSRPSLLLTPLPVGGVAEGGRSGEVKKKRRKGLSGRERREGEREKLREKNDFFL